MSDKTFKPLRDWNAPSYDPMTGRAATAFDEGRNTSIEGCRIHPSSQVEAGNTRGEGGAPGWSEVDRARTQKHKNYWSER